MSGQNVKTWQTVNFHTGDMVIWPVLPLLISEWHLHRHVWQVFLHPVTKSCVIWSITGDIRAPGSKSFLMFCCKMAAIFLQHIAWQGNVLFVFVCLISAWHSHHHVWHVFLHPVTKCCVIWSITGDIRAPGSKSLLMFFVAKWRPFSSSFFFFFPNLRLVVFKIVSGYGKEWPSRLRCMDRHWLFGTSPQPRLRPFCSSDCPITNVYEHIRTSVGCVQNTPPCEKANGKPWRNHH